MANHTPPRLSASYLAVASFTLLCYEYATTLDDEIRYFWSGKWTLSRILYFINRYLPLVAMALTLLTFFSTNMSTAMCEMNFKAAVLASFSAVLVIQAMHVLRTYYLFSHSLRVRVLVVSVYLATTVTATVIITMVLVTIKADPRALHSRTHVGCTNMASAPLWPFFVTALALHTVLYGLTTYRAMTARSSARVLERLRRDGGLFFLVVLASVGLTGIGAFLRKDPTVSEPAIYSNFMLVMTSVSMSRMMHSIHSLAANLGTDPDWLLNNLELSRVRWTKGAHDKELIVEVDFVDCDRWESGIDEPDTRTHGRPGATDAYYAGSAPYSYY